MKRLFALLLLPTAVLASCCWTLISSNYDIALQKWVCVYQSSSGTLVREFQNGVCSITPQYH
jgi:hypothetical protein